MTRIEKINLLKQVKAGKVSLKKQRVKWWSQDWSDPTLFHCNNELMYSTGICPKDGIPNPGEVFGHVLYYHADIQFADSVHLINDLEADEYLVIGKITLYRQKRTTTLGKNFGLYLPNEKFDSGFIF
jgi:hypothetical protein